MRSNLRRAGRTRSGPKSRRKAAREFLYCACYWLAIPRERKPDERFGGHYAGSYTSDEGVFVLSDVPKDAWLRLHAIAPAYGQATIDRVQACAIDELPSPENPTLVLGKPHSLRVEAITEFLGKPIPEASVTLKDEELSLDRHPGRGYDDLWGVRAWTDNDGVAAFSELVFGEATVLNQRPAGLSGLGT